MAEAMCSSSKLPEHVKVSLKGSQALPKSDNIGAVKRSLHECMLFHPGSGTRAAAATGAGGGVLGPSQVLQWARLLLMLAGSAGPAASWP